jgi:putative transcriptional regulator
MNPKTFAKLVTSVRQAGQIARGRRRPARVTVFRPMDVKAIRRQLGLSQAAFAALIGVPVGTLRNWEQGRRVPDGPARALLRVTAVAPDLVAKTLSA